MNIFYIWGWIKEISVNQASVLGSLIGGLFTLIAAIVAASTAILIAFIQIPHQFEEKVIYEGWKDLQDKLFSLQNALSDYDSQIIWLKYFLSSQNNSLVNGGNKIKYRQEKWNEISSLYTELVKAYVSFLRSFENHEFIFLKLKKMMKDFQKEFRTRTEDKNMPFMENFFPEMYGKQSVLTNQQLGDEVQKYWQQLTEISAFLDDFRVELQNETVAKILHRKVPKRVPKGDFNILTRKGFVKVNSIVKRIKKLTKNK